MHRTGAAVTIDYAKVQSMTSAVMRLIAGRDKYRATNQDSANRTAALLASYVDGTFAELASVGD